MPDITVGLWIADTPSPTPPPPPPPAPDPLAIDVSSALLDFSQTLTAELPVPNNIVLVDNYGNFQQVFTTSAVNAVSLVQALADFQQNFGAQNTVAGDLLEGAGSFDSDAGFYVGAGWSIASGVLTASATSDDLWYVMDNVEEGTTYQVKFNWTHSGGTLYVGLGSTSAGPSLTTFNTSGLKDFTLVMGSGLRVQFFGGGVSGTMDDLTIHNIGGPAPPPPSPPPPPPPPGPAPAATTAADYTDFLDTHFPDRPYSFSSSISSQVRGSPGIFPMDALSNTPIRTNGGNIDKGAYTFRARHSTNLTAIKLYWGQDYASGPGNGYSEGNGGTIRIRCYPDNGSGLPNEGGTIYSTATISPNLPWGDDFPSITMTPSAALTAGNLYHLVFENIHASPASNWISIEGSKRYPNNGLPAFYEELDWILQRKYGSGAWTPNVPGSEWLTPVLQITQAGNTPYGHALYGSGNAVSPNRTLVRSNGNPWRTRIIPTSTRTWYGGAINCNFITAGTVNWTLKTSGGTTLASGSFSRGTAYSETTTGTSPQAYEMTEWFPMYFNSTSGVSLTSGSTYYLEYMPAGSCQVRVIATQDGRGQSFNANVSHSELTIQHWYAGGYISTVPYNHTDDAAVASGREFFKTS